MTPAYAARRRGGKAVGLAANMHAPLQAVLRTGHSDWCVTGAHPRSPGPEHDWLRRLRRYSLEKREVTMFVAMQRYPGLWAGPLHLSLGGGGPAMWHKWHLCNPPGYIPRWSEGGAAFTMAWLQQVRLWHQAGLCSKTLCEIPPAICVAAYCLASGVFAARCTEASRSNMHRQLNDPEDAEHVWN